MLHSILYEWTGEVTHNACIISNGLILVLRLLHLQLSPGITRQTAQGVRNVSVKHRRPSTEAELKDWNVKACHAINEAITGLQTCQYDENYNRVHTSGKQTKINPEIKSN